MRKTYKTGGTKMLVSNKTNGFFGAAVANMPTTYADQKNARFNNNASQVVDIQTRWNNTLKGLPVRQQQVIAHTLAAAIQEFRRRNPHFKKWKDIEDRLARAVSKDMTSTGIDCTMQRLLNIEWVIKLLTKFAPTKVIPIQVYQPDPENDEFLAWDGQHTLVLLWVIATQIFGEDPSKIKIPVNIYSSHYKSEMRSGFVSLNSNDGNHQLDLFDLFEQMVFGVRIDGSTNPDWLLAEKKQCIIEKHGLFLTSKKFGDADMPGAISRMQEVNKLTPEALDWLCEYLVAVGANNRAVEEKEMVMMAYFFDKCRLDKINVTTEFIYDIAAVSKGHWGADYGPASPFWVRANMAYAVWHNSINGSNARTHFNKEPVHGYPFMVEQFKKDLPQYQFPSSRTSSEFIPDLLDLF